MGPLLCLIVGLGKTGQSIARYLKGRGRPFAVFDTRHEPSGLAEFKKEFPDTAVYLGEVPDTFYEQSFEIICSPGVALDAPLLQKAREKGISIIGDIECLARELKNKPVIAITGTNGKSTVTSLVGEMALEAGLKVAVAGNIGLPVLDLIDDGIDYDLWVLELSSFQLDLTYTLAPVAATILNVTPDHLDRHHTIEAYVAAKQRIYSRAQWLLYNRREPYTYPVTSHDDTNILNFGLDEPSGQNWGLQNNAHEIFLCQGRRPLLSVNELGIKGRHNWENALAAAALCVAASIDKTVIKKVLKRFKGLPHRSQLVRTLQEVDWINDSKGTNIGATISAISGVGEAIKGKIVLIAGGQGKGADFTELRPSVENYVRALVLIGEDAKKLDEALTDLVNVSHAPSLEAAVALARTYAKPGDVVLLSPACASLDMFRDFNHRGEVFTTIVEAL